MYNIFLSLILNNFLVKMNTNNKFYNISSFKFFRRQLKPIDIDKAFIKLLENKEDKLKIQKAESPKKDKNIFNKGLTNNNNNLKNNLALSYNNIYNKYQITEYNTKETKNSKLDLIFQKGSLDKIKKIRDLFIKFDTDKSRTLDQNEIFLMFNINKIPIKSDEVKELFDFSHKKKVIRFYDFIQMISSEEFSKKFKDLIINKVRQRTKEDDICPIDFNEMLNYLCDSDRLSLDENGEKKTREFNYVKDTSPKLPRYLLKSLNNRNRMLIKNRTLDLSDSNNSFFKSSNLKEEKIMKTEGNLKNNNDKNNNIISISQGDMNTNNILNFAEKTSLMNKEKEFNNMIDISNRKIKKFRENFNNINLHDKLIQRKQKLSKSIDLINNINSDIAENYISYYRKEDVFKNVAENKIIPFSFKKIKNSYPTIKNIKYEYHHSMDHFKKNNDINFINQRKINSHKLVKFGKYSDIPHFSKKNIKDKIMEKEYATLLSKFNLNAVNFPIIKSQKESSKLKLRFNYSKNKEGNSENTITTTINSNANH